MNHPLNQLPEQITVAHERQIAHRFPAPAVLERVPTIAAQDSLFHFTFRFPEEHLPACDFPAS